VDLTVRLLLEERLASINSVTKYPSIPTYHVLGEKGILTSKLTFPFPTPYTGKVRLSEKIDGSNSRIVLLPPAALDYRNEHAILVGSREELLWEYRDLIGDPAQGIVSVLKRFIRNSSLSDSRGSDFDWQGANDCVWVLFLETFGGNIGQAAKQYSKSGQASYRLFDIIRVPVDIFNYVTSRRPEEVARWRDQLNQPFLPMDEFEQTANRIGLKTVPTVMTIDGSHGGWALPETLEQTYDFLLRFNQSLVKLDDDALGVAEGLVIRTWDRSMIAKMRIEDYFRTLRKLGIGVWAKPRKTTEPLPVPAS
jgi:hypothetical protein